MDLTDLIARVVLEPDLNADISIAKDASFVETSSGLTARELKRQFDHFLGVGPSVRSPYAITAFVNQHGKQMFRVGNRHLTAPAAAAQDAVSPPSPPRSKRRSRMSMHHIFTPNVFHKAFHPPLPDAPPLTRPLTATSVASAHRKLRKTRSFGPGDPDQQQPHDSFTGRAHSHSVTSADVSRFTPLASLVTPSPPVSPRSGPALGNVPLSPSIPHMQQGSSVPPWVAAPQHTSDVFAQVMQWKPPKRHSFTNPSTTSFSSMASAGNSSGSYEKSLASTGGSSGRDRAFVQHPFGPGVSFDPPVRKTPRVKRNDSEGSIIRPDSVSTPVEGADPEPTALSESHYPSRLVMPHSKMLREMQSFESTMTARQIDIEPETARGTPTADTASSSPWERIDYRLLDSYDDNPNLKRPPSVVWLRPTGTSVLQNGASKLPETPEASDTQVDTAPSTPIIAPVSIANDDLDQTIPVNEALRAFVSHDHTPTDSDTHTIPHNNDDNEAGPSSSRYTSTPDVFDVLQTYSGLPLLDRLPAMSGKRSTDATVNETQKGEDDDDDDLMAETTVIRMSLTTKDESAAPRDDPRFVIWGWVDDDKKEVEENVKKKEKREKKTKSWRGSLLSGSEGDSPSDLESSGKGSRKSRPSLGSRKRRNTKGKSAVNELGVVEDYSQDSSDDPGLVSTSEGKKKALIAATIERWVAQLTSEMDYDELLVFFLTYRTYVSATDLCRVLIGRFYWALRGGDGDGEDKRDKVCNDRVRRIVRVRTFVAIRYWLIQFWPVDFVPNRELRLLMADYLNQLNRDPLLKKHVDGLGIVKRLIKAAKERRRAMLNGGHVSESGDTPIGGDESDVDLDFLPEEQGARAGELLGSTGAISSGLMMGSTNVASQASGPPRRASHPFRSVHATNQLPEGAISRVVRTTFGRLKRALNSRALSTSGIPPPLDNAHAPGSIANEVSAFEVDTSGDRSSASIRRGVEGYASARPATAKSTLQSTVVPSANVLPPTLPPLSLPSLSMSVQAPSAPETQAERGEGSSETQRDDALVDGSDTLDPPVRAMGSDASSDMDNTKAENDESVDSGVEIGTMADVEDYLDNAADTETETSGRAESLRSTSTNSFGVPLSTSRGPAPLFPNAQPPWPFDVVSIDDLELSDTSSDKGISAPPGLRKAVRKLPKKRLFWPRESVSSMGIISHASMASGPSSSGMSSPTGAGLGGKIEPWQLQDLLKSLRVDEEEEDGGVDAALKRLEGFIDPQKQEEKIKNVNEWITTIQKRMETGDYNDDVDDPRYSYPGYEEDLIEFDEVEKASAHRLSISVEDRFAGSTPTSPVVDLANKADGRPSPAAGNTPILSHAPPLAALGSPHVPDAKPVREEVVPYEILQGRMSMIPPLLSAPSGFNVPLPRLHQSFIISYRAEALAQHFATIDGELFTCIRFEELVSAEWMTCQEMNVLDWNQYLRDRGRWKAEERFPEKTSTLAVVRARFNLMTNFVISEVILTPPSARVLVFKKFLTIAFKSYSMNNFHALAAIVTGLSHELVYKSLGRNWSRISRREHRMFTNFQQFISNVDDFKYMRNAVDSISQAKPFEDSSHAASVVSGGTESKHKSEPRPSTPPACIPFIGAYLSQLHRLGQLPDLIDPTAPHLAMEIDPSTGTYCPPRYSDVFSALAPLPSFIQLEPLINVHKQRQIAVVIKSLIAGQQLARRFHFDIDKKLFHKCLRLRASDIGILQRVLDQYPD